MIYWKLFNHLLKVVFSQKLDSNAKNIVSKVRFFENQNLIFKNQKKILRTICEYCNHKETFLLLMESFGDAKDKNVKKLFWWTCPLEHEKENFNT